MEWVFIKGGVCRYGDLNKKVRIADLLWSKYLFSFSNLHNLNFRFDKSVDTNLPLSNVTFFDALNLAEKFEGRLPKSSEWEWMAQGEGNRLYPWGNFKWENTFANISNSKIFKTTPVNSFPLGSTPEGIFDVAGNLWEMTTSKIHKYGIIIRGGSYNSNIEHTKCKFWNAFLPELKSPGIGFRLVKEV